MAEPGISPRQQVAQNLADVCVFGGLNDDYGVSMAKETQNNKTYWAITFCRLPDLDGVMRVYSPNFILVQWNRETKVMRSEAEVKRFLQQFIS